MTAAACHSGAYYWATAVGVVGVVVALALAVAWVLVTSIRR